MGSRRTRRTAGARRTAICATVAVSLAAAGCGGGGDSEPSKSEYYGSIDRFCGDVAKAAEQVSRDTTAVQKDKDATRKEVVKIVTDSLQRFADSTETALDTLQQADVPESFAAYQKATTAGFRRFVTTLRTTADAATDDGADALSRLGPELNAIELPKTPPDITANAKACASFSPTG
jgi:hypothetical protein